MTKGELTKAIRRAHNIFDDWNEVTGFVVEGSGYYYELLGLMEDAVHCGAQAATKIYVKLDSENTAMYE